MSHLRLAARGVLEHQAAILEINHKTGHYRRYQGLQGKSHITTQSQYCVQNSNLKIESLYFAFYQNWLCFEMTTQCHILTCSLIIDTEKVPLTNLHQYSYQEAGI